MWLPCSLLSAFPCSGSTKPQPLHQMNLRATQRLCHHFSSALLSQGSLPPNPHPQTQQLGSTTSQKGWEREQDGEAGNSKPWPPPHPLLQSRPPQLTKAIDRANGSGASPALWSNDSHELHLPNSAAGLITVVPELGVQPQTKQIRTKTTGFFIPLILSQQLLKDSYN